MKYIKFALIILQSLIHVNCSSPDICDMFPDYGLIKTFSKRIKNETGLTLYSYGTRHGYTEDEKLKYGKENFMVSYFLHKKRVDTISIEEARCLLTSVAESFLREINNFPGIRDYVDVYPLPYDMIEVSIYFKDENNVDLGTELSCASLYKGKITYTHYEIKEYQKEFKIITRTKKLTVGEHFDILTENYTDALEMVKKQGCLRIL
jgi:hypothetical protein